MKKTKENLLTTITTEEVKEYMEDELLKDDLAEQLLKMCQNYANRTYFINYEIEDLIQDLFVYLWSNLHKFDSSRASLSTFCYMRCRAYVSLYVRKHKAKLAHIPVQLDKDSLNESNADQLLDALKDDSLPMSKRLELGEIFDRSRDITKLWILGYTYTELAEKFELSYTHARESVVRDIERLKTLYVYN